MFINILLLLLGLLITALAAKYLIQASTALAKRFGVSRLIIGLTVVSIGTSIPELTVNITSSIQGHSDMALGNILGSNIANILLVLGVSVLFTRALHITKDSLKQVYISTAVAGALPLILIFSYIQKQPAFSVVEGFILLLLSICYWAYLYFYSKTLSSQANELPASETVVWTTSTWTIVGLLVVSLSALIFGGTITTHAASEIARMLGISELVIAGTIIAIGTSIPELVTSIEAMRQKQYDIMLGNIVGSNIVNTLFILGLSSVISKITIYSSGVLYLIVNFAVTLSLLLIFVLNKKHEISRKYAFVLVFVYIIFILANQF